MQTMFGKHLKLQPPLETEAYELKFSKTNIIPFDMVKPHQREALLGVRAGFYHKITDPPVFGDMQTRFNKPRPFDCWFMKHVQGYIILWYYVPRTKKIFIKIKIEDFLHEESISDRKSLTKERALEIGVPIMINIAD